jgi:uncharacterized membrane protein YdjX (TVP38/TMEM64 family)
MKSASQDPDSVTESLKQIEDDLTSDLTEFLGAGPSMSDRREYLAFLAASILASLGILLLLGYIYLWPFLQPHYAFISNKENLAGFFKAAGNWGPIIFILLETAQVLTIFWPLPLEIAGGYLYGVTMGVFFSTIGLTLGSVIAFLVGRWLARTYLPRLVHPEDLEQFHQLMKREGTLAAFIIFLLPGVPKDFVSYLLGTTPLSLKFFVVAVTLFRLPSSILLNLEGVEAAHGHYWLSVGLMGLSYFLALLIFRYREYVYRWIKSWHLKEW